MTNVGVVIDDEDAGGHFWRRLAGAVLGRLYSETCIFQGRLVRRYVNYRQGHRHHFRQRFEPALPRRCEKRAVGEWNTEEVKSVSTTTECEGCENAKPFWQYPVCAAAIPGVAGVCGGGGAYPGFGDRGDDGDLYPNRRGDAAVIAGDRSRAALPGWGGG